jgi:sulfatase maturation enzyme AslB (radical SAM superfamily)
MFAFVSNFKTKDLKVAALLAWSANSCVCNCQYCFYSQSGIPRMKKATHTNGSRMISAHNLQLPNFIECISANRLNSEKKCFTFL